MKQKKKNGKNIRKMSRQRDTTQGYARGTSVNMRTEKTLTFRKIFVIFQTVRHRRRGRERRIRQEEEREEMSQELHRWEEQQRREED